MDPKTESLAPGAEANFRVRATGDNLHYQWQKDRVDLSDDDRHHDTGTDTLHIVKVEKSDSKARYRCRVKNEIREEFSKEAVLKVGKLVINTCAAEIFYLYLNFCCEMLSFIKSLFHPHS